MGLSCLFLPVSLMSRLIDPVKHLPLLKSSSLTSPITQRERPTITSTIYKQHLHTSISLPPTIKVLPSASPLNSLLLQPSPFPILKIRISVLTHLRALVHPYSLPSKSFKETPFPFTIKIAAMQTSQCLHAEVVQSKAYHGMQFRKLIYEC